MPRPVLSETTFNSDNVATSILQQANLQIANSNLGVSDISSHFTVQSGWAAYNEHFLFFNGFVWWSGYYIHAGSTPTGGETIITIDNADYRPQSLWRLPAVGYQGDTGSRYEVTTTGNIEIHDPTNVSSSNFYITACYFWNVNF